MKDTEYNNEIKSNNLHHSQDYNDGYEYDEDYDDTDEYFKDEQEENYIWPHWYDRFLYPLRFLFIGKKPAQEVWLGYYKNLYKTESPSRIVFKNLLSKYGVWNFPNPYRQGSENYYAYHENGVFFADIDFLLSYWKSSLLRKREESVESLDDDLSIKEKIIKINNQFEHINLLVPDVDFNVSVSYVENFNNVMEGVKRNVWFKIALNNMIDLFLDNEKMWVWIKGEIHKENLLLLCKIIYDNAPSKKQGKLVSSWSKTKWLTENEIRLLTMKNKQEIK